MEKHTERERDAILYFKEEEEKIPSLTDLYIMQLSMITMMYSPMYKKRSVKPSLMDFLLKFDQPKVELTLEQKTAIAKARWCGIAGYEKKRKQK